MEEAAQYGNDVNGLGQRIFRIMDHDLVIFMGDFNYRIVEGECFSILRRSHKTAVLFVNLLPLRHLTDFRDLDRRGVREGGQQGLGLAAGQRSGAVNVLNGAPRLAVPHAILPLLQLNMERERGNVFQNFREGFNGETPPFEPTYKFQPKTSLYERRPDKKFRAPAWCDRILWHAKDFSHVTQLTYDATMGLEISDHKPVSSLLSVKFKTVVVEKKRNVYSDVMRMLDRWENDSMPKVRWFLCWACLSSTNGPHPCTLRIHAFDRLS